MKFTSAIIGAAVAQAIEMPQEKKEVAEIFEPNKCKIMQLDLKDANECLKVGMRSEDFINAWWAAKPFTPAGIINLPEESLISIVS